MGNNLPFSHWKRWNEEKMCKSCGVRRRWRVSGYCERCSYVNQYWGHPKAQPIKRKEYLGEIAEVTELLSLNENTHNGIIRAMGFLDDLLEKAARGITVVPGAEEALGVVADRGATSREIFIEVSALHLLYYRHSRLVKSKNHLIKLTGNKVLIIKRNPCRISGKLNREVGDAVIHGIGSVLLLNFAKAVDRRLELKKDWLKEQGEELKIY